MAIHKDAQPPLKVNGFELDAGVLEAITNTDARLLWAFVRNGRRIQAIPYDETKVIWLDRERDDAT